MLQRLNFFVEEASTEKGAALKRFNNEFKVKLKYSIHVLARLAYLSE
jgi:hypothetical protein